MARIRSIKPEFWSSEQVVECSTTARLMFVGLWNFCDDYGRMPYSAKQIKMQIFPGDSIEPETIENMLQELIKNDLIITYVVDGKRYLQVTGWHHQKIDKPSKKYPDPPKFDERSANGSREVGEHLPAEGSEGSERREGGGVDERKTKLPKNFSLSERVKKWGEEKGFSHLEEHLEAFKLKCEKKGYKYVDWDAAFMEAIREDWAGLRKNGNGKNSRDDPGVPRNQAAERKAIMDREKAEREREEREAKSK